MTRKDYVLIAAVLKAQRPPDNGNSFTAARAQHNDQIARAMAQELSQDNPRFDRARFLQAAGVAS